MRLARDLTKDIRTRAAQTATNTTLTMRHVPTQQSHSGSTPSNSCWERPVENHMRSNFPVIGNMIRKSIFAIALTLMVSAFALPEQASAQNECAICTGGGKPKVTSLTFRFNGASSKFILVQDKDNNNTYFSGVVNPGEEFTASGTDTDGKFHKNDLDIVVLSSDPGAPYTTDYDGADVDVITVHVSCSKPLTFGMDLANQPGKEDPNAEDIGKFTLTGGLDTNNDEICQPADPEDAFCYLVADNDGFNNSLDGITFVDGVFTEGSIGLTGTDHIEALTFVPETGILYGSDAEAFGSINLTTGAFTYIGDFGSGDGAQGNIDYDDVDGLAYDPFTKVMYASVRRDNGPDDLLIQVDISTGQAIDDAFGAGVDYVVVQKINGLDDIDDIAISTDNGMMYAIQNEDGQDSRLITINKFTGATTDIGDLDVPNVEGLGFHPDGRLLGVNGDSHRSLMRIHIAPFSSTTTPISNLGINDWLDYEGIACLTESENRIEGKVYGDPDRIDLELDKTADVVPGQNSDAIEYTITVTNDNSNPVNGPNAVSGNVLAGVTVELYRDKGTMGVFDVADEFVASVLTALDGSYAFDIAATGAFIVRVDLSTVPNNAYDPTDNEEAISFAGFGDTSSGNDFYFYQFTDATGVNVLDHFPNDAAFVSASESQGSFNSGTMIWNVGTLAPGASATLTINATTTKHGTVENCAEVMEADQEDIDSTPGNGIGNGEDDEDCEPTNHDRPKIDLELEKSAQGPVNGEITYTITLTNNAANATVDATGVEVEDVLPAEVTYVSSAASQGSYTPDTWTVGTLAPGDVVTLEILVTLNQNVSVENCAEVSKANETDVDSTPGNGMGNGEDDQDCVETPPEDDPEVDLKLEKSADVQSAGLGDTIIYTLTLTNESQVDATDIEVEDNLPYGVTFISSTPGAPDATYVMGTHEVHWSVPFLAAGDTAELDIEVEFDGMGGIMPASPFLGDGEYVLRNHPDGNQAPPYYGMRLDDLFGDHSPITFNFEHSQSDMRMRIEDSGATVVIYGTSWGGHDEGGFYDEAGPWNVYFKFDNVVSVYGGDDDLVVQGGDVELSSGTITALYDSPHFNTNDVFNLADEESAGYSFRLGNHSNDLGHRGHDGISGWGWLQHDGDGNLSHKSVSDFLFTAFPIPEELENCAQIMEAGEDDVDSTPGNAPDFEQEDDDPCFSIPRREEDPEVDIEVEKTASDLNPEFGDEITYTITVTNNGPDDASNLEITDVLPAGVSYVSHVESVGVYNPITGIWTITALPAFASETLEITVQIGNGGGGLNDGVFQLHNHPGNDLAPPGYGLRLDELFGGLNGLTFDFDHNDSDVQMTISGSTVTIEGEVYGGQDAGGAYDPATEGLWDLYFEYTAVVSSVPGDDDLYVDDSDSETSFGTISPQYNSAWFTAGDIFDLGDKSDGSYSFRLGDEDNDLGYNGYPGISGWGWLKHGQNGNLNHVPISDWIFTAVPLVNEIENCAELTALTEDDIDSTPHDGTGDDYDCVTVTPGDPVIDLELEKDVDLSEASVGDILHYTITVKNADDAGATATNVVVQDEIPEGLLIIDTNPNANVVVDAVTNTVTWTILSLAPGQSLQLDIEVQILEAGFFCNCAEVISADQPDVDDIFGDGTGEDYDCAVTTTDDVFTDLSLDKAVFPTNPGLGDVVDYTITVRNDGAATQTAFGIQVVDNVPAGLSIQSTDPIANVSVNNLTNIVSWFIPSLAPGDEVELHIYAQVDDPGDWENCAEIMAATGNEIDSTFGNGTGEDIDCVSTWTPDPTIDLSLEKTVDDANPTVGQDITFTLSVTNDPAATEDATGVVVEDQLPGGVTIDPGFNHPDVMVSLSGLVTWNVGTVAIGDTETLDIPVEVTIGSVQQNCAEITAADQDDMDSTPDNGIGNGEDDEDCVTITPDLIPSDLMCYLVADNEDHFGSDDVLTYITAGGTEVSIGITGTQNINAIEYVGEFGKLYASDGNRFGTLNPGTGVFSPIGFFGAGIGVQGAKNFDDVDGLALDPYTGILYGTVRTPAEDLLIQINMLTGAAVVNAWGPAMTYLVIPPVSGLNNVDDIAIQLSTGTLFGVMNGAGNSRLVTIDKTTGASANEVLLDVPNVRGLTFRANGQLVGSLGSTDKEARSINIGSGATALLATLGIDGNFDYESITCNTNVPNWLSGTVFLDNNEDALLDAGDVGQEDVDVLLYRDTNNNQILDGPDVHVGTLQTNADGYYHFPVLSTGRFIVTTDLGTYPAGAVLTTDNIETAHFTGFGQNDPDNDFGFKLQPVVLGSIGDFVFDDANANGFQDIGETGIGGVLVRLYSGACPAVGFPIATRVSNPAGGYDFTGLPAGTYCVDVEDSTVPVGYVHTTANDPMTVVLANGEDFNLADFGYYYNPQIVQADLEVTKEVDTSSPALDDVVTFTITVTNHGPADATGLIVRDIIPVGLVFEGYTSTRGSYEANKLGFWTIGDLAVGQTETLRISTKVVITNMIENIAQVSHVDQEDPDSTPGNGVPTEDDQDNALVESRGPGSVGDIIRVECADMGTVNALQYSLFDDQIYAGTEVGSLHISNDEGQNWPVFMQTDNDAPIRDIVVDGNGYVYAGSFGDGVYRSTDEGDNWTNIGPVLASINDLDVDDNTDRIYAADDGKVIVFNGFTWSTVGAGTNPFGGQQVLAVVYDENNGRLLASSAGSGVFKFEGGVWTDANSGLPTGKINVLFNSPNGEILAGTNNDGVYVFGGGGWFMFGMGLDDEPIESIGSGPNGELLAGARESGAYFYNYITGEWMSIGNLPVFTVSSMTAGLYGEVYAGAPGEGIYVIYDSDFDGIPDIAHQVANFMTNAVIQDLVVAPNGDMWAATYGYGILYSSDGGNCWTRMNRGLDNLWTFAIERRTDGWLYIGIWADGLGGIWRSKDDGRNWEFLAYPTRQIISLAIDPTNEDIIYAGANIAGGGALFKSMDGGDSWAQVGNFNQPVWSVTVDPNDGNHVLVGTLGDGVYESFNMGFTFDQIGSPINGLTNAYVFDLAYAPFGTPYEGILFAATDAGVYRYDEFAETWALFGIGSENFQFRTLAFAGLEIFGGTWNAGVVLYNALTNEWGDYGLADMPVVAFAVHQQSHTLVIGTSGSGVYLAPNLSLSTSVEDEIVGTEIPTNFALEQNYPNPFNPQTTIPFDLRETSHVTVGVYDVLGREMSMLVDGQLQAGQHQVTWDAGDIPSGTYLIRMEAGGQVFTRTMVLLK